MGTRKYLFVLMIVMTLLGAISFAVGIGTGNSVVALAGLTLALVAIYGHERVTAGK